MSGMNQQYSDMTNIKENIETRMNRWHNQNYLILLVVQ
jgi:hypothetical protein